MPDSNSSVPVGRLCHYACDFCREKKLKCSRELPKCDNCRPWPGSCEYSRDASCTPRRKRRAPSSPEPDNAASRRDANSNNVDRRLKSLEQSIQSMTNAVNQVVHERITSTSSKETVQHPPPSDRSIFVPRNCSGPGLYFGPSNSTAPGAPTHGTNRTAYNTARDNAYSELQQLSTAAKLAPEEDMAGQKESTFYVPSKQMGYRLISKFFEQGEAGKAFFRLPPDETVRQAIFEPSQVQEKAWVVSINYMLLSAFSAERIEADLVKKLRRNTQLALNDSGIFLEPSTANVQALALLALHGEDYAAPSLSWMLLGHACRQAEVLGLHAPSVQDPSRQHKLCLFWLLFMADKSCALSFGRPAFLPTTAYRDISVPDEDFLLTFHPHENEVVGGVQSPMPKSTFGAHLISRSIKMSTLTGEVLDLLTMNASTDAMREMQAKLGSWHEKTNEILVADMTVENASTGGGQTQEISLGITSLKFQYLHVLILLLRGDDELSILRLDSSREAIALLPSMVSNWSSVYNGVIWQLLYYPFVPFFVIFEAITHHRGPLNTSTETDLGHLSTTVSYFQSMRSQVHVLATVCARLQHVASAFHRLAQVHLSKEASRSATSGNLVPLQPLDVSLREPVAAPEQNQTVANDISQAPDMNDFLEWLPADLSALWPEFDGERMDSAISGFAAEPNDHQASSVHGRSGLDATFDWFSWDAYYKTVQ